MSVLALLLVPSWATPPDVIVDTLVGESSRGWEVDGEEWKTYLGLKCRSGKIWTFTADGVWSQRECVKGSPVVTVGRWAWATEWPEVHGPYGLLLDGSRYLMEIRQRKAPVDGDPPVIVLTIRTPKEEHDDLTRETVLTFQDF